MEAPDLLACPHVHYGAQPRPFYHPPFLTGWPTFLKPACCSYQDSAALSASPSTVNLMISSSFFCVYKHVCFIE